MNDYNTRIGNRELTAKQPWGMYFGVGALVIALFLCAVMVAGWTVNTAYRSAHLQQRERVARERQKILQEQLAQASSLNVVLTYAEEKGFKPAAVAGALEVTTPVADGGLVR